MHTVSRIAVVAGADANMHLALGCSHGNLKKTLCGQATRGTLTQVDPPCRACDGCGELARRHHFGFIPRASHKVVAEFGFPVPEPDPLNTIAGWMEDLGDLDPSHIGPLGTLLGSVDASGTVHADRFCVGADDDMQPHQVTLGENSEVALVGAGHLHCVRGMSEGLLDTLTAVAMVRSERIFLKQSIGPARGWDLFLESQPPYGLAEQVMIDHMGAPVGSGVPGAVIEAHGTNRLLWDSLLQAAEGWDQSPAARQATDRMTALNALARGNLPRGFAGVETIQFSMSAGHVMFVPAGARVGLHGEIAPLRPICEALTHTLVHGDVLGGGEEGHDYHEHDGDEPSMSDLPTWCAEDVADFLVTQDLLVQHYADEIVKHCPGQVVSLDALPPSWQCWPHREHQGYVQCWVPASILMAEHLRTLLEGPYMVEEAAERWLR